VKDDDDDVGLVVGPEDGVSDGIDIVVVLVAKIAPGWAFTPLAGETDVTPILQYVCGHPSYSTSSV